MCQCDRLALAWARANHLAVAASATAAGVFEPNDSILGAVAQLAAAVEFDLRVLVAA